MPQALEAYQNQTLDTSILRDLGSLGLLGLTIKGYGCAGASYVTYGLVARGIKRLRIQVNSLSPILACHASHNRAPK
ncbi:hypothetical protein JAAARDRAFT_60184 [Jaapia argillacea MUCL 33604]|uniref:Acyl-CoA dehydrogenase/oxidase N-terminal domain-containing protein n=1 Tax=Jaapia argillacea MUCL 33604 TaxID=933084 RepID=A0A067PN95_9AGAM|nr:hypothetical protein JAAARDRAFT_60184 [Jaapia argillacea MUCL 33604]